jgi:hypothetical protein
VLISSPGSNTPLAVLPLEHFSGDPDLAKKWLRPEIFLSLVSYQNTIDQQREQILKKGWRRAL